MKNNRTPLNGGRGKYIADFIDTLKYEFRLLKLMRYFSFLWIFIENLSSFFPQFLSYLNEHYHHNDYYYYY